MSPVGHQDLWTRQGWVDFSAAWRTGSISGSQDHSVEPCHRTAEWSPHHRSSFYSGAAAVTLSCPQPFTGRLHRVHLQERRQRPRALRGLAPRPHSWSDWPGIRSQVCLTVGEDPQDKAGLGVTERGSDNVTAKRAPGGPNSFHLRGKRDMMLGPW